MFEKIKRRIYGWMKGRHLFNTAPMDYRLLMTLIVINAFGIIMIYSASYYYCSKTPAYGNDPSYLFMNQLQLALVGLGVMLAISFLDYRMLRRLAPFALILSVLCIGLLLTPLRKEVNGAVRWIQIFGRTIQVAEPVKLGMIFWTAHYVAKYKMNRLQNLIPLLLVLGGFFVAIYKISDNMSTAIIVLGIGILMIFVTHPGWKMFIGAAAVIGVVAVAAVLYIKSLDPAGDYDFRIIRVLAWLYPESYADAQALQPLNSLYAIGSGGFWGRGLGQSLQKYRIPEPQNDFILAIISEELGLFGVLILLFLFVYLMYRVLLIANSATDRFGRLLAGGVFLHIAIQVVLNVAVVSNFIPTTGVTLPFISSGGTAVVFLLMEFGQVFSVDRTTKEDKIRKRARAQIEAERKYSQ